MSEAFDSDEDVPEDVHENDQYLEIPHQNDLDLGRRLVHRFIREKAPQLGADVDAIFSRRGAYSRYKDLLHAEGLLDAWYEYESAQTTKALQAWCAENGIELKSKRDESAATS